VRILYGNSKVLSNCGENPFSPPEGGRGGGEIGVGVLGQAGASIRARRGFINK
jgi:hypothetical protein